MKKIQVTYSSMPPIEEYINEIKDLWDTHWLTNMGKFHKELEEKLKGKELIGLGISNCCAIEIIEDKYRLLKTDASNYGIEAYGIKAYWYKNKYREEYMDGSSEFKKLEDLLTQN